MRNHFEFDQFWFVVGWNEQQSTFDRRFLDFLLSNAYFCNSSSQSVQDIVTSVDNSSVTFGFRDIDGWCNGNMHTVRGLSLVVQSTAYSVLQHVTKFLRYPAVKSASEPTVWSTSVQSQESQSDTVSLQMLLSLLSRSSRTLFAVDPSDHKLLGRGRNFFRNVAVPFLCQLLGRKTMVHNEVVNDSCFVQPFRDMSRLCRLAAHLPWPGLNSATQFPDPASILYLLHELQRRYDTGVCGSGDKEMLPDNTWHFCARPLLQTDLNCTLVTSLILFPSSSESILLNASQKKVFTLLLLAKIAQLLMEPQALQCVTAGKEATEIEGMSPIAAHVAKKAKLFHADPNAVGIFHSLDKSLRHLQGLLCDTLHVSTWPSGGNDLQLLRYVMSGVVVFVECLIRVTAATRSLTVSQLKEQQQKRSKSFCGILQPLEHQNGHEKENEAQYELSEVNRYVEEMLESVLGLPGLEQLLLSEDSIEQESNGIAVEWCKLWAEEVRDFYVAEFSTDTFSSRKYGTTDKIDIQGSVVATPLNVEGSKGRPVMDVDEAEEHLPISSGFGANDLSTPTRSEITTAVPSAAPTQEEEFEDLDALNALEDSAARGRTENGNNNENDDDDDDDEAANLLRIATMDNLRSFLVSFNALTGTPATNAQNLPDIHTAVQYLVRRSRSLNEELQTVLESLTRVETQMGMRQGQTQPLTTAADHTPANNNIGNNADASAPTADNTGDGIVSWSETQRVNTERAILRQELRRQRRSLILQVTRHMSLLMMLMAANDRHVSVSQIVSGEVDIQLTTQTTANQNRQQRRGAGKFSIFVRDASHISAYCPNSIYIFISWMF